MPAVKKIVCTVDFADHSSLVASYAKEFAQKFDAEVLVLYVAPALAHYSVDFEVSDDSVQTFVKEVVTGAEANMKKFVAANFSGVKASGRVATGYVSDKILEIVDEVKADMIIMGTHGRSGLAGFILGSVAEKIVKLSKVPVLTVHPQKK
ncbi:universal stress protein [Desulfovibrio litoralis]|uniref:Universal stress protein n=1 Tax=Desulfovibrio litoralis DSM 11393 TaxID=1121455 RepID=A0A1M7RRF3_9BACT|nr:universal stress protein [Desulfovibrio litoralis]SHN48702.1 Nucleotide-binding universal stress protein, UspA family [Desulfovibrio litoralis DSM 11393]